MQIFDSSECDAIIYLNLKEFLFILCYFIQQYSSLRFYINSRSGRIKIENKQKLPCFKSSPVALQTIYLAFTYKFNEEFPPK